MPTVQPPNARATHTMSPKTKVVCDALVSDGLLTQEQLEAFFTQMQRSGDRVE